ncbi:hypothetical protein NPIL_469651 [Nephila pilipes]|uniref:Uncharacterized protein n=1 Tax=Nephila pilipes TaxID=299642 RepID=A0A8X6TFU4_NEPPI|nr:hypothetical protein NPIL_469651 [Nephila pilipes]
MAQKSASSFGTYASGTRGKNHNCYRVQDHIGLASPIQSAQGSGKEMPTSHPERPTEIVHIIAFSSSQPVWVISNSDIALQLMGISFPWAERRSITLGSSEPVKVLAVLGLTFQTCGRRK